MIPEEPPNPNRDSLDVEAAFCSKTDGTDLKETPKYPAYNI
jgi:hypothetical protein